MKCLKEYWDIIHPELAFFTERKLREQATRIEKNVTVMATKYSQTQISTIEKKSKTPLLMMLPPRIQQLRLQLTML